MVRLSKFCCQPAFRALRIRGVGATYRQPMSLAGGSISVQLECMELAPSDHEIGRIVSDSTVLLRRLVPKALKVGVITICASNWLPSPDLAHVPSCATASDVENNSRNRARLFTQLQSLAKSASAFNYCLDNCLGTRFWSSWRLHHANSHGNVT